MRGTIGDVCIFTSPFYDNANNRNSFKKRPALIIGIADTDDYNVLPVSTVTRRKNIDPVYDIPVNHFAYNNLNLSFSSFIRVHKQTVFHDGALHKVLSNMKSLYPELYLSVIAKLEEYNKKLIENTL
ncbi:MAG: hypothetical protein FWG36_04785 [Oscillospiraceae bacterium]|nr:hypothetical protein [Oscillospiraceae bacterium]